jgi:oligoribonuclease NrnB/cAMP/cGMP phosphodiesterase (DHH superfamily)
MNVYHLSHTDLDGYGCQYLTNKYFKNIKSYNANYGPEIKARLEEILFEITKDNPKEPLILITDLNLAMQECIWLEEEADSLNTKIVLLDHHISGEECAISFDWYHLDISKSATAITYDWLRENFEFDKDKKYLPLVQTINAIDIWLSEDRLFEIGKVGLGMINGAKEINRILFPNEDRELKLFLIDSIKKYIDLEDGHIKLDNDLHKIKKEFFKQSSGDDTKDNLVALFMSKLLTKNRDRLTIEYKGFKGLLGYSLGNSSILGNRFLVDNPDYDFYMDINYKGTFSLRSNNRVDVAKIAEEIGNGGGHKNASGGKIKDYKDSFIYSEIKNFVQNHLNSKEIEN